MFLKCRIPGTHIAVPIVGIEPIRVNSETGELIIPPEVSEAKVNELKAYLKEVYGEQFIDPPKEPKAPEGK